MPDAILEALGEFERRPQVAALARERYVIGEVSEVLDIAPANLTNYVSRDRLMLVSDRPARGPIARQFCSLDVYTLSIFDAFNRHFRPSQRKKLIKSVCELTFGEPATRSEIKERRETFAKQNKSPGAFAAKVHEARRKELKANLFAAQPLWWVRDPDRHFFLLMLQDCSFVAGMADRRVPGSGQFQIEDLQELGVGFVMNVTQWLSNIDKNLADVLANRDGPELVEARTRRGPPAARATALRERG